MLSIAIKAGGCHFMTKAGAARAKWAHVPCALAPGALRLKAELAQFRHQAIAVIALDLDYAVLHRTARTAQFLQPRRQLLKLRLIARQPADHGHTLAATACDLAADAHPSITGRHRRLMSGSTLRSLERRAAQHDTTEGVSGLHT